jgi:hypothetical protein
LLGVEGVVWLGGAESLKHFKLMPKFGRIIALYKERLPRLFVFYIIGKPIPPRNDLETLGSKDNRAVHLRILSNMGTRQLRLSRRTAGKDQASRSRTGI